MANKIDPDIAALPLSRHGKYARQWERDGKCNQCGSAKRSTEHKTCVACRRGGVVTKTALWRTRRDAGLCGRCGGAVESGYANCAACRAKHLAGIERRK